MKKTRAIGLMLALMLTLTMLFAPQAMADDGSDDRIPANDIVIVVDQSRSMDSTKQTPNDPDGYRIDAAQMIVGMCDMENSRVAIVPFAGTLIDPDTEFRPINDQVSRDAKMAQVGKLHNANTQSDTDMGNALSYAVKLLIERDDKSNNPMIIVLTDGKLELTKKGGSKTHATKKVYLYNKEYQSYSEREVRDYGADNNNARSNDGTTINATTQLWDAVDAAIAADIPVYCVALNADDAEMAEYAMELSTIADRTGGDYFGKEITDPATLPQVFAKVFADQIGSSLREELHPVVDGSTCTITIPILNSAVLEANIYIPLDNVKPNSFELYQGDSTQNLAAGGEKVIRLEGKRFTLYKIRPEGIVGDWTLKFELEDEEKGANGISLNLLYNYDVTFATKIGANPASLAPGNQLTLNKNDNLYITSSFYQKDPTTETLVQASDVNLYRQQPGEAWRTIHVTCELVDAAGVTVYTQELNPQPRSFDLNIDLKNDILDSQGYSKLPDGDYTLRIVADGAGLRRENELKITLANNAPNVLGAITEGVEVNNPEKPETTVPQTGLEMPLSKHATDPDNDRLTFYLQPRSGQGTILNARAVEKEDGSWAVVYDTLQGSDGKVVSGTAEYDLTVTDSFGKSATSVLTFQVASGVDDVLNGTDWITTAPAIQGDKAAKNTDIAFELEVTVKSPSVQRDMNRVSGTVTIVDELSGLTIANVPMQLQGDKLVGVYHTENKYAKLKAVCDYQYGGFAAEGKSWEKSFEVPNTAPYFEEKTVRDFGGKVPEGLTDRSHVAVSASLPCDPLPSFLGFLEPDYQPSYDIDLNQWFGDDDNELGLVFDEPLLLVNGVAATNMAYIRNGDVVTLQPNASGNVDVVLRAVDGDGQEAVITMRVSVKSLVMKWIIIAAAAVVLIIVIYLIYMASRPRFFKGMRLTVRSNTAIDPDQVIDGIVGQKAVKLSAFVVEPISLQNSNVTAEDLEQLSIKPMRGRGSKVLLTYNARKKNLTIPRVDLGGVEVLAGKSIEWTLDTELEVHHTADNGNCLRITLESQAGNFSQPLMMDTSAPAFAPAMDSVEPTVSDTPDW